MVKLIKDHWCTTVRHMSPHQLQQRISLLPYNKNHNISHYPHQEGTWSHKVTFNETRISILTMEMTTVTERSAIDAISPIVFTSS